MTRPFKTRPFGDLVDLDDPATFDYLPNDIKELRNLMFREIGYALLYMNYFPNRKDFFPTEKEEVAEEVDEFYNIPKDLIVNSAYYQRKRVEGLIEAFAKEELDRLIKKDIKWFQEQIFLFQDETENMC